jgi:FAD/FMN-containing dehydrogenase
MQRGQQGAPADGPPLVAARSKGAKRRGPNCQRAETGDLQRAFLGSSAETLEPVNEKELADVVRWAESQRKPLIPSGHGAHAFLGNPAVKNSTIVSLRRLDQVLRYEPDDFTIGVQAGVPLVELRETLRAKGQEIAVDLPRQGQGTIGGLVATERPGPRRGRFGPVRASIIGVHSLRGGPSQYKAGGMVVKNVAGYEVARFLAGSFGTAGFLTEINFKLRPLPGHRSMRVAAFSDPSAAWQLTTQLRARHLDPSALSSVAGGAVGEIGALLGPHQPPDDTARLVVWLFEGSTESVTWQETQVDALFAELGADSRVSPPLPTESIDSVYDFLCQFCEFPSGVPDDRGCARIGVLPSSASELETRLLSIGESTPRVPAATFGTVTDALTGLSAARWQARPSDVTAPLRPLRETTQSLQGTGVLVYLPPAQRAQWEYLLVPDRNRELAAKILKVFDPLGVFAPGRLHGIPSEGASGA